jgi:hypothetical protein
LAGALPFNHYHPDAVEAKDTDQIRDILTAGLLVLTLEHLRAKDETPTIGEAKATIIELYESPFWSSNTRSLGILWGNYKPVAHLCAAWLRLLDEEEKLHKDRRAFDVLKGKFSLFLQYAAHYEHFLTLAKATGRAYYNRHDRTRSEGKSQNFMKTDQLWSIVDLVKLSPLKPPTALPKIGLRPHSPVGSSDNPSLPGAK